MEIRPEEPGDVEGVYAVNAAAFPTEAEAKLVDVLRDAGAHVLSLVAVDIDEVIGHILFSPVTIEGESGAFDAIGLAPMSVLPDHQRSGIGSQLVNAGLERLKAMGHPAVVVLGHPDYYPRFGFVPSVQFDITCEFPSPPEVFMVQELIPSALKGHAGEVKYHPAFKDV